MPQTTRKQNLSRATLAKGILYPLSIIFSNSGPIKHCVYLQQIAIKDVHYCWVRQQAFGRCNASDLILAIELHDKGRNKTIGNTPTHTHIKARQHEDWTEDSRVVYGYITTHLARIVAELRADLRRGWFMDKTDEYRQELVELWSPFNPLFCNHEMLRLDSLPNPQKRGHRIPHIDTWDEHRLYNKPTVFYWTESAITMKERNGPRILGGIWNAWCGALGREPHIQLDEFFAIPVSVPEVLAKTIPGILRAHEQICAQVRKTVEEKSQFDALKVTDSRKPWRDPRYFKLHPICEALIAVFDEYKSVFPEKHADGFRHFDDVAQKQSIILARTGHEDRLSAPISFESLKDKALPLARREKMGTIDVIRVPLQVGVSFVATLLLREEAAFPESHVAGHHISSESDHPFMKWEREAQEFGEKLLAPARAQDKIKPFTTEAAVKKAVPYRWSDTCPPVRFVPSSFQLCWI